MNDFHLDPFTETEISPETSSNLPSTGYFQNSKTLRDLSGKWVMSKSLSVGIPKALEIQDYQSPEVWTPRQGAGQKRGGGRSSMRGVSS
ncbi:hypothetical protein BST61_g7735 [Cercospora zeina]